MAEKGTKMYTESLLNSIRNFDCDEKEVIWEIPAMCQTEGMLTIGHFPGDQPIYDKET